LRAASTCICTPASTFSDEDAANAADPLLNAIEDDAARNTLIARPDPESNNTWAFNVVLRGEGETVFLDI
jgi:protocatechuate 3,4-dioxygenase alpha subunit